MQFRLFITVLLLAFAGSLQAQVGGVTATLIVPQESYISGEDVSVTVNIVNQSGRELAFDGDASKWLSFKVDTREQYFVRETGMVPVMKPLVIPNGTIGRITVNLANLYNLEKSAGYEVKGVIAFKNWDKTVSTPTAPFKVFKGINLKALEFGYSPTPNEAPSTFKYVLQSSDSMESVSADSRGEASRTPVRNNKRLYVRIVDANNGTLSVFPICPLLDVSKPESMLDSKNSLHVFVQTGATSFTYTSVNPAGKVTLRQTHEYDESRTIRPKLRLTNTGNVIVYGGNRRLSSTDYPPEKQNASAISTNLNASVTP
ncbi:MAG: hypothetical protein JWN25_1223 [Verrucomicrobiales bacterium]|nr:hypothetical protein [Verrucomicrobiales bacterium]